MLLEGLHRDEIAALRIRRDSVNNHSWASRQHHVRGQRALLLKLNRPLPPPLLLRREQVRQHLEEGRSQKDIARTMGITRQAVQSYTSQLRKRGLIPKPKLKRDEIAQLLAEGLTPKQIAQRLGLNRQNVYDHVHVLRPRENSHR